MRAPAWEEVVIDGFNSGFMIGGGRLEFFKSALRSLFTHTLTEYLKTLLRISKYSASSSEIH
jgi:hypothetical protein